MKFRSISRDTTLEAARVQFYSKLEWAKADESEQQYRDALGVASVQWRHLNWEYMEKWASDLGADNLLEQLREDANSLQPT